MPGRRIFLTLKIIIMKKILSLIAIAACAATMGHAQDNVECEIKADLVSSYIWRGQDLGDFSVQPTLGIAWKGLSLSAWGSVGLTDASQAKELDLTLAYSKDGFNCGITDYWFSDPNPKYFEYHAHKTSHLWEANVGYDFGKLSLQWYTNFAGNDGVNKKGKRAYSSYVEAAVPFTFAGLDWTGTIGAVPYATTAYLKANGFAVVNVSLMAVKNIKITDSFSLPLFASINTNPSTQKAYFVVGLTIQP